MAEREKKGVFDEAVQARDDLKALRKESDKGFDGIAARLERIIEASSPGDSKREIHQNELEGAEGVYAVSLSAVEMCLRVIYEWEGRTYGCHGKEPSYGMIGFTDGLLTDLLDRYKAAGGVLANPSDWYARNLREGCELQGVYVNDELEGFAKDHRMQVAQESAARDYFTKALSLSAIPRGLHSPLGQLIVADAAVNNGLRHEIWEAAEDALSLPHKQPVPNEGRFIVEMCRQRMDRRKVAMEKEGVRRRYEWYMDLAKDGDLDLLRHLPVMEVNGRKVRLAHNIVPFGFDGIRSKGSGFRRSSPVDPNCSAGCPSDWTVNLGYARQLPNRSDIPAAMRGQYHSGWDLNWGPQSDSDRGKGVYAIEGGQVLFAGPRAGGWGTLIVISHDSGVVSRYAHVIPSSILVKAGMSVRRGQMMAEIGGQEFGYFDHLHFDLVAPGVSAPTKQKSFWPSADDVKKVFVNPGPYIDRER